MPTPSHSCVASSPGPPPRVRSASGGGAARARPHLQPPICGGTFRDPAVLGGGVRLRRHRTSATSSHPPVVLWRRARRPRGEPRLPHIAPTSRRACDAVVATAFTGAPPASRRCSPGPTPRTRQFGEITRRPTASSSSVATITRDVVLADSPAEVALESAFHEVPSSCTSASRRRVAEMTTATSATSGRPKVGSLSSLTVGR